MIRRKARTLFAVGLCIISACGGSDVQQANDEQPESLAVVATSDAESLAVEAREHRTNTLIAQVSVTADAATDVLLHVASADTDRRTLHSARPGESHEFTVVGLRAETTYSFTATTPDGEVSDVGTFTSGPLPMLAPDVQVLQEAADSVDGITIVARRDLGNGEFEEGPLYFGFDGDGFVTWYLPHEETAQEGTLLRHVGDGLTLASVNGTHDVLTPDGHTLDSFGPFDSSWDLHHDFRVLDNGNGLTVGRETRQIGGAELVGDILREVDIGGNVIWEWATFDHLDTTRVDHSRLTRTSEPNRFNWTHLNGTWVNEQQNEILVSLRSQGWVVSIDRGSGDINWIAGDRAGASPSFDAPFLTLTSGTWFSGQHAPQITADGNLLVFDNRAETGGPELESRAVMYEIDRDNLTATQILEAGAGQFAMALGDVDELPNGNILVVAGIGAERSTQPGARITEIDSQGNTLWEVATPGINTYRAERISWAELDALAAIHN